MIQKKVFGRTGHYSTRTLFGAVAFAGVEQKQADETFELLLEAGVNHVDVAASYGDAELRLGPLMKKYREQVFLATKTGERTYEGAWKELQRSLERMQTDHIDLWQMHGLYKQDEWDVAMSKGGALEAFIEAREKGLVRYLGVTGHGLSVPGMHMKSLKRFDFDSVLLPYNFLLMQIDDYRTSFEQLLAMCAERNVAVQTIKSLARRPWNNRDQWASVWYEPLKQDEAIRNAVHWVLGDDRVFLNTTGDVNLLPKVLKAASEFESRPSDETMRAMMEDQQMDNIFQGDWE
ncbi:MAG: aldo/keto reductase [Anaerolineaceae bacterium]|nr:aldo/keto reductase [Anaerolineaceae bacterium]